MENLYSFLDESSLMSDFKATLSQRGGYITFSNSGRRGSVKYFQIGLDSLLQTLHDIAKHLSEFEAIQDYDETSWRDNGSQFFTDPVANANSTVQTKPLFSTLSKVIKWSNQPLFNDIDPDKRMIITEESINKSIIKLEEEANKFKPLMENTKLKDISYTQIIFYGAPGTGKSFTINETTKKEKANVIRTTFHPDTDYASFVGAYKPTTIEQPLMTVIGTQAVPVKNTDGTLRMESKIVYEFVNQSFLKAYVNAWKLYAKAENTDSLEKQYLIIEEINRGNCAQIFGDLFQLLDRNEYGFSDYPIEADADMEKQLRKQLKDLQIPLHDSINNIYNEEGRDIVREVLNGKILLLPNNLYIWATMNTSDQSLFPIDSAFKRRWDWKYMPISDAGKNWIIEVNGNKYDWWKFLNEINGRIYKTTFSEDKKLGYFFCKADEHNIISVEKFVGKVIFYLWNDVFKDYEFEGETFSDSEDGDKLTFDKFYQSAGHRDVKINEAKVELFLKNLGLEPINENQIESEEEDYTEDDDFDSHSNRKGFRFALDGIPMKLGNIAKHVVINYAKFHPDSSAIEIRDLFVTKCKGIGIAHIVETEDDFKLRADQASAARSANKVIIPNGDIIYVSTMWNAGKESDNFYRFKTIVNENNWGVITELNQ